MKAKPAFIFPGQGSQRTGMLSELATHYHEIADTFDQASNVLGYDLWDLVSRNPDSLLDQTEYTQPALLTSSVALWRCQQSVFSRELPSFLAGHSLGEYSALVCSEALSFSDAINLVRKRGSYMQEAMQNGSGMMLAIVGLDNEKVISLCQKLSSDSGLVIEAANFNAPGQVVVAGESGLTEIAEKTFSEAGARKVVKLPMSVPSHCSLMKHAAERLAEDLANVTFSTPKIPVVHNVNASVCDNHQDIASLLTLQLVSSVRWTDCIEFIAGAGVTEFYECGPGKILTGLCKRINRSLSVHQVEAGQFFS